MPAWELVSGINSYQIPEGRNALSPVKMKAVTSLSQTNETEHMCWVVRTLCVTPHMLQYNWQKPMHEQHT